ncbi:unnamed protein product [Rotaria magnacalcarata]|uniref:Homeobox domain-containing protein n=3 Tax=Rotaria magnacalcarata TaxID=392030 RepID=A0A816RJI8_9BILA|nr:unnamed protein product [Rotaria magnacalcarata]CAF1684391.1 unnamed protein product [Rotaria magnacalcarata]CAF2072716.1 unnamed protein product [Rotaria magnacalcarata]CAF2073264.1 unnamed protein product [Rotaria magnacalcarata]CAF2099111.1 unnamed protein product [Rotaria magnacalcarata]
MSSAAKSFLIKDILSENGDSTSSDESNDNKDIFLTKPIDLRQYFKHPLYPIALRPSSLLLTKSTPTPTPTLRNAFRLDKNSQNSPLDALFEMTKKTFDKTHKNSIDSDISLKLTHELHKRKRRKNRTAFTAQQIYSLEKRFTHQRYLTPNDRDQIANDLQLSPAQVITWFQNRRAKLKRDYEELKNDVNAARKLQAMGEPVDFS